MFKRIFVLLIMLLGNSYSQSPSLGRFMLSDTISKTRAEFPNIVHIGSGEFEKYTVEIYDGQYWELWFINNRLSRIWMTSSGKSPKDYEATIYNWKKLNGREPDRKGSISTGMLTEWTRYFWNIDLLYHEEEEQIIVLCQWDRYNCGLHSRLQLCSNRHCIYTWKSRS